MRKWSIRVFLGIIALVSLIGIVYAFTSFTQYFPSVVVQGNPRLSANCGTSTGSPLIASTPGTGTIIYSCSADTTSPALTVVNGPVTATPTTTFDSGSFVPFTNGFSLIAPGVACSPGAGIALTAGVAVSIPNGTYNYCATTDNGGTYQSFTVTWS